VIHLHDIDEVWWSSMHTLFEEQRAKRQPEINIIGKNIKDCSVQHKSLPGLNKSGQ
jgi:hypothetical protein